MKSFIVFTALFAVALAASLTPDGDAQVLHQENDNIGLDGYKYGYDTSNGIAAQEEGVLVDVGTPEESLSVRGAFRYTGTDGVVYEVVYTAGKDGFQPEAAHIPKL